MTLISKLFKEEDEIVIKPIKGFVSLNIRELWRYRELLITFTWRDIKVRYTQTILGILWAVIPPLLSMIIFSIIFGRFVSTSTEIPYPIFVYIGTFIWTYFSTALTSSSNSLVNHQTMIQKIYFPRIILPLSSIISGLIDFGISFVILIILMIYYQFFPGLIGLILIPVLLLITMLSALGFGLLLSAINVKYRDVKYALPFFVQIGLFITPVIYPLETLEGWSFLLWLNPMTSVIENARAGLLSIGIINWHLLIFSLIISIFYFVMGLYYFKRSENYFADII